MCSDEQRYTNISVGFYLHLAVEVMESFDIIGFSTLSATSIFHVLTSSMSIIIDVGTWLDLMHFGICFIYIMNPCGVSIYIVYNKYLREIVNNLSVPPRLLWVPIYYITSWRGKYFYLIVIKFIILYSIIVITYQ